MNASTCHPKLRNIWDSVGGVGGVSGCGGDVARWWDDGVIEVEDGHGGCGEG